MAVNDPVDDVSMIFTEGDVYMICGYLAKEWGIDNTDGEEIAKDTETAITAVLQNKLNNA